MIARFIFALVGCAALFTTLSLLALSEAPGPQDGRSVVAKDPASFSQPHALR